MHGKGSLVDQEALCMEAWQTGKPLTTEQRFSHVLSQTQTLLEMPVLSGDPKHGSLSLQEVIRTML
jgi:hypothetical protein